MTGEFSLAVHALVFLNHKKDTVSSEALAENICTNPARVRKIMALLKKADLVKTQEGRQRGGYRFEFNPAEVTLTQIADAVSADFVAPSWRSGSLDKECLIASGMAGIMDNIYADLNSLCRERLKGKTIADIDKEIFGDNN